MDRYEEENRRFNSPMKAYRPSDFGPRKHYSNTPRPNLKRNLEIMQIRGEHNLGIFSGMPEYDRPKR